MKVGLKAITIAGAKLTEAAAVGTRKSRGGAMNRRRLGVNDRVVTGVAFDLINKGSMNVLLCRSIL